MREGQDNLTRVQVERLVPKVGFRLQLGKLPNCCTSWEVVSWRLASSGMCHLLTSVLKM